MNIHAIILAAGKGTRMNSATPKVLHKAKDVPMIDRVLASLQEICPKPTIIVGYGAMEVINHTKNRYRYIFQKEQLGTGHAVMTAKNILFDEAYDALLVLPGDHPFIESETLKKLIFSHIEKKAMLSIATLTVPDFFGDFKEFYNCGRVVRDKNNNILKVIESKDANRKEKKIKEVAVSYYCFNPAWLWKNIGKLKNDNKAKEFYLTDLVNLAVRNGESVNSIKILNPIEGMGVNTHEQLEVVERHVGNAL